MALLPFGLYLHVPFCLQRCTYCDFFTLTLQGERDASFSPYIQALLVEIEALAPRFALRPVSSIYFGGGTPSLLTAHELEAILSALRKAFVWQDGLEISLEVNPETIDLPKAQAFKSLGVDRLSIGVQALDTPSLARFQRAHDAKKARSCLDLVRKAGFSNVNLDLIFGRPDLTLPMWEAEIDAILTWEPDHLSLYELILEPGTPMTRSIQRGEVSLPEDDLRLSMYQIARERLRHAGFVWYEISNYCKPGYACRHNVENWKGGDYLGLGPGAHSFHATAPYGARRANPRNLPKYLEAPNEAPWLPRNVGDVLLEGLMNGLRLLEGFRPSIFQDLYQMDAPALLASKLLELQKAGYLVVSDDLWYVTDRGAEILDSIVGYLT